MITDPDPIFRFRITLQGIEPEIWRLIDVPEWYDFWDLHVAITDAMGWLDYHLHLFTPVGQNYEADVMIGIPDEDGEMEIEAGWEVDVPEIFFGPEDELDYLYDFGDSWLHRITLVDILTAEPSAEYPRCVDGARACPPEDCGGSHGYYEVLEVLADPENEEYEGMMAWLEGHPGKYHPYDPEAFDPSKVVFSDPDVRWDIAFMHDE